MVHINEILELNTEKRIELVELIWDSIEKDKMADMSDEMKTVIDNSMKDYFANPT
jgi:putative addiction module component (TIGR02574 family)